MNLLTKDAERDEAPVVLHSAKQQKICAFLWIDSASRSWNETLSTLARMELISSVYVGYGPGGEREIVNFAHNKIVHLEKMQLFEAANTLFRARHDMYVFITAPVRVPLKFLDLCTVWLEEDPRIGTVSFLSNAGGYLSFPHRNTETRFCVDGHDETSLTDLLRRGAAESVRPVPLPISEGAVIVVGRSVWEVCGELDDIGSENMSLALADLSLRGARRGFNSFLDPFTYVMAPYEDAFPFEGALSNPRARHSLHLRHHFFPAAYDAERDRPYSVLAQALDSARAKALGLRVLIDGSVLGPKEMGTQSLIVNLSTALADRREIQYLVLAAPDPANLPEYARALGRHPKVRMIKSGNLDFPDCPFVDIIHRPFQPTEPIPWARWRSLSKRSVITVQDLVAYRNGAYFPNFDEWDRYRDNFNRQIALCDAVVSISHDVVTSIEAELMPIDGDRVFVIENGIDARSKEEAKRVPDALLRCGWAASSYLLVLGATYAHKNRDLAIRTWVRLREMGLKQKLVLVGPSVPHGSSRADEAMLMREALASDILVLPEVSSEERNWLLTHTALLIYVTSAEGFGLVPFEAASLGAATLYVSFGPLRELIADPEAPRTYDVELLARRAYALIVDPAVSQSAINAVLKDLDRLSWQETARKSIQAYYSVLDRPSRVFES